MIKLNKSAIVIISLSLFLFVGYNVLTTEATESNDKKVCEDYNGEWKNIGGGKRGCTFENDDDAEKYGYRPGFSLDGTGSDAEYGIEDLVSYDKDGKKVYPKIPKHLEKETPQQVCEDTSGEWKDGTCKFSKDEIKKGYDVDFDHSMEQEGLWDNYAIKQRDKKLENICNKVDGKWTKSGCETDNDGPKADKFDELVSKEPGATIVDGQYGVVPFQTPEPEDDKEKREEQPVIEDGSNIVTPISDEPPIPPPSDPPSDKEWTKSPTTVEYENEEDAEQQLKEEERENWEESQEQATTEDEEEAMKEADEDESEEESDEGGEEEEEESSDDGDDEGSESEE